MNIKKLQILYRVETYLVLIGTLLITALVYALWGVGVNQKQEFFAKATDCTPNALLANPCRPWVGATAGGYTMAGSDIESQLLFFNKRLNNANILSNPSMAVDTSKKADIAHVYHQQGSNLFSSSTKKVLDNAAFPYVFVNWKPLPGGYAWKDAGGNNSTVNDYIRTGADQVKALGSKKIFLTLWHEPENDVSAGNCAANAAGADKGSPAEYVAMWRNVRNIFNQQGVSNVVWAINYMGFQKWDCLIPMLWPGNEYVDWIVFDQYASGTQTFNNSVQRFYDFLANSSDTAHAYNSKLWGMAEHGYGNSTGNSTESGASLYWQQAKTAIENNTFPKMKMWLVFDTSVNGNSQVGFKFDKTTVQIPEQEAFNGFANAIFAKETPAPPGGGPPPDSTPPSVSISSPVNGTSVSGTISITVSASDNVGVTAVKLYIDNTIIKDDTNGSDGWSSNWPTPEVGNGAHTLKAVAYDAAGNNTIATSSIVVNNVSAPPASPTIQSFTAEPATVTVGSKSMLSWSTANTASCSVTPGGPTNTTATSWQTLSLTNVETITYTLVCKNSAGTSVSASKQVVVQAAPTPPSAVVLTASSTVVAPGDVVTLSWTSSQSTSCTLNPGSYTVSGGSSSKTIVDLTTTTTFKVTCKNDAGAADSNTVQVSLGTSPPPLPVIASLTATPASLGVGSKSTLSWAASNVEVDGCNLSPSPLSSVSANSSWTTPALDRSVSYTLTCKNSAGAIASKSVSIKVADTAIPAPPPPASLPDTHGTSAASVTASNGQQVVNTQVTSSVVRGDLLTLEPSTITDSTKISAITKVEFYDGNKVIGVATKEPFALPSKALKPGTYNITQRTYFADGGTSEKSQVVTITARNTSAIQKDNGKSTTLAWIIVCGVVTGAAAFLIRYYLVRRISTK